MDTPILDIQSRTYPYSRSPDQDRTTPAHHRAIIVGAGPVGLSAAIDLALSGTPVLLLDDDDRLSTGSRAICFAKRTLEIFDRLGAGAPIADKGVGWSTGRVFLGEEELYHFDLLGEPGHHRPAFVNIQQYYVEAFLLDRAHTLPNLEIRWRTRLTDIEQTPDRVHLTLETPDGAYRLTADYLVAADGARSPIRRALGHESRGQTFRDRFLIADVRMQADFPAERRFWFDPPFHPGQSVLLHRQPDNVWRIDFQLGWDADPVAEREPDRVIPRLHALFGPDVEFTLEWVSVYTFSCQRMASFRDGRVLFAGDSAHGVSPFGARGANSGVQDADNLAWKLALVLQGHAPDRLLDTYAIEREHAADENIRHSTRSTDFITPKSPISRTFRDAVLDLARTCDFARPMVNSGRLSTPTPLHDSPLNTADTDPFTGPMHPGAPCTDAPLADGWLLDHLGPNFTLLHFGDTPITLPETPIPLHLLHLPSSRPAKGGAGGGSTLRTQSTALQQRYDARPGTTYLIRPDQHVAARWRTYDPAFVLKALDRALAREC